MLCRRQRKVMQAEQRRVGDYAGTEASDSGEEKRKEGRRP